jgi:hypothetical protein
MAVAKAPALLRGLRASDPHGQQPDAPTYRE